ncbi:acetyltransferase [Macrococcus hajekii]|nr:GNAT family protein [Macrococcus hajekii]GGB05914.1 acetyltransferase [Macrococcus hajekii]
MLSYKVDEEIELVLPRPEIDGRTVYQLIDRQRDYLKEFLPWSDLLQNEEQEIAAFKDLMKEFGSGQSMTFVVHYNGETVGMIDFHNINCHNHSAEIGYWLSQDMQGKGIITRAVKSICRLGFDSYQLNRIVIIMDCDNTASKKVAERSGFHYEGKLRSYLKNGEYYKDAYIYSLLKKEN